MLISHLSPRPPDSGLVHESHTRLFSFTDLDAGRVLFLERYHFNALVLVGFDLGLLERVAGANLGALIDGGRLTPTAQGRAWADVGTTHVGAPDAAPAANQHDSDRDERHCGQGEQGCSSPVRGDMKLEAMYASFLLEAHLCFGHLVGPEVGRAWS